MSTLSLFLRKSIVLFACLASLQQVPAQYRNVQVNRPLSTSPEEVTIANNPVNPLNLIAGANLRFYYWSTDGGSSWTEGQLPSGTWGDPCVIFDARGNAYYGHLSNYPSPGYFIDRIIVHRSSDGGRTWYDSAAIGYNPPKQQDKDWLAADMTNSQFRNNVYVAWTEFDKYGSPNPLDSSRILFSRTTDAGRTWSRPLRVSDDGGDCEDGDYTVEGAVPTVGPNGEVYLAWAGPRGIMIDKSTDGGVTFGKDVFVTSQPGGWDFGISGIYRCNGMPVTACDASNSLYRGHLYVLWSDQRNGVDDTDVFLIQSTDGGATWGQVKRVNDDITSRQQFFPWMAIDQSTGYLYIVFYDRRNTQGDATDVYLAKSTDGGNTFSNFTVSQSSFTPQSPVFFGDYVNIAAHDGFVYPIWMRMDGRDLSAWVALVTDTTAVSVRQEPGASAYRLEQNFPNPFNPSTTIRFTIPAEPSRSGGTVSLQVFDVLGRIVGTIVHGQLEPGAYSITFSAVGGSMPEGMQRVPGGGTFQLSAGVYFYRLQAGEFVETKKLVVTK